MERPNSAVRYAPAPIATPIAREPQDCRLQQAVLGTWTLYCDEPSQETDAGNRNAFECPKRRYGINERRGTAQQRCRTADAPIA